MLAARILPLFGVSSLTPVLALTVFCLPVVASVKVIGIESLRIKQDPSAKAFIRGMRGTSLSLPILPNTLSSVEHIDTKPFFDLGRAIAASTACIGVALVLP